MAKKTVEQICEELAANPRDVLRPMRKEFADEFALEGARAVLAVAKDIWYRNGFTAAGQQFPVNDPTLRKVMYNLAFYMCDYVNVGMEDQFNGNLNAAFRDTGEEDPLHPDK